jgi:MFS family permease
MGVMGLVLAQWCISVVFGMGAVYGAKSGMTVQEVAWFMGAMMAGGMVLQWPLGQVSDRIDRRWVIGFAAIVAVIFAVLASLEGEAGNWLYLCAFVFGGCCLSQYSLVVALTHDHLRPAEIVPASGTIVMIAGVVSISGPIMVAFGMQWWGLEAYFQMMAVALLLLAVVAIWRALTVPALPPEYKTHSAMQAPATPVGSVLHPEEKDVV